MKKPSLINITLFVTAISFVFVAYFMQTILASTSEHFQNSIDISANKIVQLSSLFFIVYGLMQLPIGVFIDKVGIRVLLPISLIVTFIGATIFWSANSATSLLLARTIEGLGTCAAYIIALYIASNYFKSKYFVLMVALVEMISMLGDILATEAYGSFINFVGWDCANYFVLAGIIVLVILALTCSVGINPYNRSKNSANFLQIIKNTISLSKNTALMSLVIYIFFTWSAIMSMAGYWAKEYFGQVHDYSNQSSLQLMEIYWIGLFIGCPIVSMLATKFGRISKILILLAVSNLVLQCVLAQPKLLSYNSLVLITFLIGFVSSGVILAFSLVSKVVSTELESTAVSLLNMGLIFGGLFGQLVFGQIMSNFNIVDTLSINVPQGNYYTALILAPISSIIACIASFRAFKQLHS